MLSKEDSGSRVDLGEIQDSTKPLVNTSKPQLFEAEDSDIIPNSSAQVW